LQIDQKQIILNTKSRKEEMNKLIIRTLLVMVCCQVTKNTSAQNNKDAIIVLEKIQTKMQGIKRISYNYTRGFHYLSENYHAADSGKVYLDFTAPDTVLGFKYQAESENGKGIFNGSESFYMSESDTTIDINYRPGRKSFQSLSFLYNSPVTIRLAISAILKDKEINKALIDTIINRKPHYLLRITMKNKALNGLGDFSKFTIQRDIIYKIVIDKKTYLPLYIIQTNNDQPGDYTIVGFQNYKFNPTEPAELSWYSSTYTSKYKLRKELILIKEASTAPFWELPLVVGSGKLNLEQLKGKVVLLEFWFKNCGPCIAAVPELNSLKNKYNGLPFELIGINAEDTQKDALWFVEKRKVSYTTVYEGNEIAKIYGISGYPTTVLLDKNGAVLYAGSFDKERIENLINKNL
jgi:thiol-disulfide isomerase/thioredoxin